MNFNASALLAEITGVDLTQIFGVRASTAIEIISEVGLDLHKWPTEKHFTSWLNLAPNNKKTGGKVISSRIKKRKIKQGKHLEQQQIQFKEVGIGYLPFITE